MLEHAVLVNATLVRERVCAHDGFVGLDNHASERGDQGGCAEDLCCVDVHSHWEKRGVCAYGHHNLLKRRVARSLANAVDRDFNLPRTADDAGQSVGRSKAKVIVAVGGPHHLFAADSFGAQGPDHVAVLLWGVVPDRVGDVEGGCPCVNDCSQDLQQEGPVAASGILRAELHIVAQAPCEFDRRHSTLDALSPINLQLVLQVNVRSCQEGMDSMSGSVLHGFISTLDVIWNCSCKTTDHHGLST
mmetsp:Transcript_19240/g.48878  ORF Transcript_19240/g.48878 Transcript_19240/m.48878 type:complete len:245 (-) Transcript_19240:144-878(-)